MGRVIKSEEKESLGWAKLGIIAVFLVIPNVLIQGVKYYALAFVAYAFLMMVLKKKGAPLIFVAMGCCIPLFNFCEIDYAPMLQWLFISLRLGIVVCALYQMLRTNNYFIFKGVFLVVALMFLVNVIYESPLSCLSKAINSFIYVHLFFLLCYYDKISLMGLFKLTTLIFVCVLFYSLLQYYFDISPYKILDESTIGYEKKHIRVTGICGNSLVLVAIILAYQSLLLIVSLQKGKIYFILELLIIYILLISFERTAILGLLIEFIIFSICSFKRSNKKIFFRLSLTFGIVCLCLLFVPLFNQILQYIVERFQSGSAHRFAAFPTVWAIFEDNIYGVGPIEIDSYLLRYGTIGLIEGFGTLDNFYLTQIAYYGIFAIVPIFYYLYYLIKAVSLRKKGYESLFQSVCLIFIIWGAIGFSFNIEAYAQLRLIFYGLSGYSFSIYYLRENATIADN